MDSIILENMKGVFLLSIARQSSRRNLFCALPGVQCNFVSEEKKIVVSRLKPIAFVRLVVACGSGNIVEIVGPNLGASGLEISIMSPEFRMSPEFTEFNQDVSQIMQWLKGISSQVLLQEYPHL